MMQDAGQKLKRARERLRLTLRDVEEASGRIAARHGNEEFGVPASRLSEIETKGIVPSVYRMYSLCAIYRLDLTEVLSWFGVSLSELVADADVIQLGRTHEVNFKAQKSDIQFPLNLDPGPDLRKTAYLSRLIQKWGRVPLMLFDKLDPKNYRYGFIGTEDWSMFPLIPPGSLVVVDDTQRRAAATGWNSEFDRPIYFVEHEHGYSCRWCMESGGHLILQAHPSSSCEPEVFKYPGEIEILGRVTQVAMTLGLTPPHRS